MFSRVRSLVRAIFQRDRFEDDMSAEMRFHLDACADDLVRAGMTREEALRRARLDFGGIERAKEEARQSRGLRLVDELGQDFRYAHRVLRRSPVFALTAVLSLAVGIGANTTIFTVANGLLFHEPVDVEQPSRLVDIGVSRDNVGFNPGSYSNYLDLRERTTTLAAVYASELFGAPLILGAAGNADRVESVSSIFVTSNYFSTLGAHPAAGRLFDPTDGEQRGATPLVVLSHRFWSRRFNQDPAIVGATLQLNGRAFTVVGVTSEGFQGTRILVKDVWLPMNMIAVTRSQSASVFSSRGAALLVMGGRLKPGVSVAQAASEVDAIGQALEREFPEENRRKGFRLAKASSLPGAREPVAVLLALLMAIVALVLLVACANIAGVLLSRAAARRRELAIRMAMGAGRARLARQLLTETAVLGATGGALGLLLARGATSLLGSLLPALPFPINVSLALDTRVLLFTTGVSLVAVLLCGLVPALLSSKADLIPALKDDAAGSSGRARLRNAFVTAQVAVSILLVVIGSLFVHALQRAGADPGFDPRDVYLASLDLSTAASDATGPMLARQLTEAVRQIPGVASATLARVFPRGFEGIGVGGLSRPGAAPAAESPEWDWNIVESGYFATLRIPLVAGRDFDASDRVGTQPVIILGEDAARYFWPSEDAIGKFILHSNGPTTKPLVVIGVARDVKSSSLIDGMSTSFAYLPLQQNYTSGLMSNVAIAVRTTEGQRVLDDIRTLVPSMNARLAVGTVQTLESYAALGLAPQRILASVAGGLGLVGLLLASLGIYGVTAYAVTRRRRELGIRVALGATPSQIRILVLRQGASLIGIGSLIGLTVAALFSTAASQILTGFLFGVAPLDPVTFLGVPVMFAAIGLAACYAPTRRATASQPVDVLRE